MFFSDSQPHGSQLSSRDGSRAHSLAAWTACFLRRAFADLVSRLVDTHGSICDSRPIAISGIAAGAYGTVSFSME